MTYRGGTGTARKREWWTEKGEEIKRKHGGKIRQDEKVSEDMKVDIRVAQHTTLHFSDEGNKRKAKRKEEDRTFWTT
jgi:hypothetical protein